MLFAMAYQESGLNNSKKSHRGAVGIMQIMPATALDRNVAVRDFHTLEGNIKAATRYLHFLSTRYFSELKDDPLNMMLFTFAAYNAGPARVNAMRRLAAASGFNRDIWFGNVEIAAARMTGRETVNYVANIYRYYIAYKLIFEKQQKRHNYLLPGDVAGPEPFVL
jgi:membrane-bound lytic murein transglycosylase MltF